MLRPVPSRPPGPVDPAEAARHVAVELPELDEPAASALALVVLAGRSRAETAAEVGVGGDELALALARARKALRRALHPLPGSGWCERAERLMSDRIDGALEGTGPARLDTHLANCGRCVEHERRLAQAEDGLVAGFVAAGPAPPAAPPDATPAEQQAPPALRVIDAPVSVEDRVASVEDDAAQAEVEETLPGPRTGVALAGGLAWTALAAIAVLLVIGSIALAIAGALGAGV